MEVIYDEGDDLKCEVIWSANEDATGVHEVLWSANTWWPDKPASERLRLAEDAVPALYFWRTAAGEAWLKEQPVPRSWARRTGLG